MIIALVLWSYRDDRVRMTAAAMQLAPIAVYTCAVTVWASNSVLVYDTYPLASVSIY